MTTNIICPDVSISIPSIANAQELRQLNSELENQTNGIEEGEEEEEEEEMDNLQYFRERRYSIFPIS